MRDDRQRLDKWLWFARFARTRPAAVRLVEDGHVRIASKRVENPALGVKPGDVLTLALPHATLVVRVTAFGGEADFTYPPRPANRREPWNIEHVVKVRYGSTATPMLGMDMSGMDMGDGADDARVQDRGQPAPTVGDAARSLLRGLGGLRRRN